MEKPTTQNKDQHLETAPRRAWTVPHVTKLRIADAKHNSGSGSDGGGIYSNHS